MSNFTAHSPADIHDVLMGQLPHWFKPVLDYIAIMRGWSFSLSDAEQDAADIKANFYIQTCDEQTLALWEKLLGIQVTSTDSMGFRRIRVLNKLATVAPFTWWDLKDRLTELFGNDYTVTQDPQNCWIKFNVTSDRYGAVPLLRDVIHELVPVHLYVYSNQQVTNFIQSDTCFGARMTRTFVQTIKGV